MKLTGLYTALVTPFDGEAINLEGLRKNIHMQVQGGVDGLVVLGTTGESPSLTEAEREQIVQVAVREAKGQVQVIVGTGTNSTASTIDYTVHARQMGADAALVVNPYYNKPTQRGLYDHFAAISEATDLPVIAYNHPGRTGINIDPLTMKQIADLPNVVGVKECSGDLVQTAEMISHTGQDFAVLTGNDPLALATLAVGGAGVISTCANLLPEEMVGLVHAVWEADWQRARQIYYRLLPLFRALELETNPIPIKAAMNHVGLPAGGCRLPLTEMSEPHRGALHALLEPVAHG